jgi:hypothetical protein
MTQSFDNDNQNDDTREVMRDHDTASAAEEGNTDANGASARHNDKGDDAAQSNGEEIRDIRTSRPRARRTSTRNVEGKRDTTEAKSDSGIIQFSGRTARNDQRPANATASTDDAEELAAIRTLDELKAQGFTADEAIRLIHVSDRLANGREARESQTTLRRLRFTRWLIEHGVLDEFTA